MRAAPPAFADEDTAMPEAAANFPIIREAVASFADRDHFRMAATGLLAVGFAPDDLSVLASHESLDVAGAIAGYKKEAHAWMPSGLADEIKYLGPLTVAGIIMLSGGPIAASLAALVGAGLGGAALKEVLDRYTSGHSEEFAAALEAGAVLLWARCEDAERELSATRILEEAGGRNVHVHGRSAGEG
jgi:hypothetical protein